MLLTESYLGNVYKDCTGSKSKYSKQAGKYIIKAKGTNNFIFTGFHLITLTAVCSKPTATEWFMMCKGLALKCVSTWIMFTLIIFNKLFFSILFQFTWIRL